MSCRGQGRVSRYWPAGWPTALNLARRPTLSLKMRLTGRCYEQARRHPIPSRLNQLLLLGFPFLKPRFCTLVSPDQVVTLGGVWFQGMQWHTHQQGAAGLLGKASGQRSGPAGSYMLLLGAQLDRGPSHSHGRFHKREGNADEPRD